MKKIGISALMALFVVSSIVVPALAQLTIDLNINNSGSVEVPTGVATISGTLTCSQPSNAQVFGALTQQGSRRIGTFSAIFQCNGGYSKTPWTATVSASFLPGPATVSADAIASIPDPLEYVRIHRDVDVILRPQKKQ